MNIRLNIFKRVLLLMILMSLFASLLVLGINIIQATTRVNDSLISENVLVAKLAVRAIESGSLTRLWPFELLKHIQESEDTLFWWVVTPNGRILLADDPSMQNKIIRDSSLGTKSATVRDSAFYKTNERIKLIVQPLNIGDSEEPYSFFLGVSLKRISSVQKKIILGNIGFFIPIILLAILLSFYLSKSFTKPITFLMDGVEEIARGNLDHQIKIQVNDEFSEIANAFNEMTIKLKEMNEREKLISEMKSEFISIAAHQLRTPLTAIKWIIKMVLDGDAGQLNKDQQDLLSKGYISNERIIMLVNDLLNVSRIEEGKFGLVFKKHKFENILNNVLQELSEVIKRKNISLSLDVPKKMPILYLDKEKIEIALMNIIDNAVKYTHNDGQIQITVKIDKLNLIMRVKDNGVGIPLVEQDRLFTKFFRGSNVLNMETEGSGLGLFIARNIIESHGGGINIQSVEKQGTEISISLPIGNKCNTIIKSNKEKWKHKKRFWL